MATVSTTPKVTAAAKFRRAALAAQWSVKAVRKNKYAMVDIEPKQDEKIVDSKSEPSQGSTEIPALKKEDSTLPARHSFSAQPSKASVKLRRAALAVQWATKAKNISRPTTIAAPTKPQIEEAPQAEVKAESPTSKKNTSIKFRRAVIAVQFAIETKKNFAEVVKAKKEARTNIINKALSCVEDTSSKVTPVEVESASTDVQKIDEPTLEEEKSSLPKRSCLKSSNSSSPKTKKSVSLKKHARVKKTAPRSYYTKEMAAAVWYSHAELQKIQDKIGRKMTREGLTPQNFWPLEEIYEPYQVQEEPQHNGPACIKPNQKITFSPSIKKSDIHLKQELSSRSSDQFPWQPIAHAVCNRAA